MYSMDEFECMTWCRIIQVLVEIHEVQVLHRESISERQIRVILCIGQKQRRESVRRKQKNIVYIFTGHNHNLCVLRKNNDIMQINIYSYYISNFVHPGMTVLRRWQCYLQFIVLLTINAILGKFFHLCSRQSKDL